MKHTGGLFKGNSPGRADKVKTTVAANSFIIPADVVSGIGQGNTMAGTAVLDKLLSSNKRGMKKVSSRMKSFKLKRAGGGPVKDNVKILASDGEYNVTPEQVTAIGNGDIDFGHKVLHHFVKNIRKKILLTTSQLPEPQT